jgi:hypothetical protein
MADCDHEEADSRMLVHLLHALEHGANIIQIRTVDSDVIVILIGQFHDLVVHYPLMKLWVAFNSGKDFCFYHINSICDNLRKEKSQALPEFHAFTGSDTTSAFKNNGKVSAWNAWKSYSDVTSTFLHVAKNPFKKLGY